MFYVAFFSFKYLDYDFIKTHTTAEYIWISTPAIADVDSANNFHSFAEEMNIYDWIENE